MQRLEHPRLVAPVLNLPKALERFFAHGGVAGKSWHDELEFGFAVGILWPVTLLVRYLATLLLLALSCLQEFAYVYIKIQLGVCCVVNNEVQRHGRDQLIQT